MLDGAAIPHVLYLPSHLLLKLLHPLEDRMAHVIAVEQHQGSLWRHNIFREVVVGAVQYLDIRILGSELFLPVGVPAEQDCPIGVGDVLDYRLQSNNSYIRI